MFSDNSLSWCQDRPSRPRTSTRTVLSLLHTASAQAEPPPEPGGPQETPSTLESVTSYARESATSLSRHGTSRLGDSNTNTPTTPSFPAKSEIYESATDCSRMTRPELITSARPAAHRARTGLLQGNCVSWRAEGRGVQDEDVCLPSDLQSATILRYASGRWPSSSGHRLA